MDQEIRNKLRNVVTQCRKLLEDSVSQELEGKYGIFAKKEQVTADPNAKMTHLTNEEQAARKDILDHFGHIKARGFKPKEALDQLVREIAFTHLNRLCAYKMMEAREVYVGGQKFRESVSRGINSNGVKFYLADHPDEERLFNTGHQDVAYRHFLDWLGGLLSDEIGVLFNPSDPANRLYPRQKTLDEVLDLLNDGGIKPEEMELREAWPKIWSQDETIGWVYQYFTPKELRDQARKESQVPRNSYELAFRNQFFTPRYVVEFLTDNTLGRIWYEMQKGHTKLKDQCRYMVRRPTEVFLADPAVLGRTKEDLPPNVQAAFRGDFANAIEDGWWQSQSWLKSVVPIDQYEAATGHHLTDPHDHPSVSEVWDVIHERPDSIPHLQPLKIIVAFARFLSTASGGPYASRAGDQLWAALTTSIKFHANQTDMPQSELLKQPNCIPHRQKKDPRELKILDPACGSGHFLLYCFDLLLTIYEEAYADPELGPALQRDYPKLEEMRRDVPRLILAHNLHGIDIDLRASQIAALALWLRCQRAYQDMGLKKDRPNITRSNFVCAEPMPGEEQMLKEFVGQLEPKVLGQVVEVVFDKMKLAGEAGSLLKIEEEIRDAMTAAKKQYLRETTNATDRKGQPLLFTQATMDRIAGKPEQPSLFDLSDISDSQFFEHAEARVIEALRSYAEKAQNGQGFQRRLFTEDAVRGFAFVDLCQKWYDVVLMNPPFGACSESTEKYFRSRWNSLANDIYVLFLVVFSSRLTADGRLGAITSRGFMIGRDQREFRPMIFGNGDCHLDSFLDLGPEILDTATVETCAYVLRKALPWTGHLIQFIDCRTADRTLLAQLSSMIPSVPHYVHSCAHFLKTPDCSLIYTATQEDASALSSATTIDPHFGKVTKGLNSSDDFRFMRLMWEVPSEGINRRWRFCAKGGEYCWFVTNITTVLDWQDNGHIISEYTATISDNVAQSYRSSKFYGKPALTFTTRCRAFSLRALPEGCLFTNAAPVIVAKNTETSELKYAALIAVFLSEEYTRLLPQISKNGKYETGPVGRLPLPPLMSDDDLKASWQSLTTFVYEYETSLEISPYFVSHNLPAELTIDYEEFARLIRDLAVCSQFNPSEIAIKQAVDAFRKRYEGDNAWPHSTISFLLGIVVGRWGYQKGDKGHSHESKVSLFSALPSAPPGSLATNTTLGECADNQEFDGLCVDDPDHERDICRLIRAQMESRWPDLAAQTEENICKSLAIVQLREYFRQSGGFWSEHIKRYTSCRRVAPIYWLLQSSKKSYSIWLYYHRLDKDVLFKALVRYVEPKIRLEVSRLDSLRSQKVTAGESGKEAKRLAKDVERQEDVLSELRDFEDKLRRAANLHLEPDLNDGVVLNIAPLWELVPWKEAKSYWDELLKGEYGWSSIGKQLRQKGLVK